MQETKVFLSQLEAIMLHSGCDEISAVSEHLQTINNQKLSRLPSRSQSNTVSLHDLPEDAFQVSSEEFNFYTDNKHHVWIKAKVTSQNVANQKNEESDSRQIIKKHSDSKSYYIVCYFQNRIPGWMLNLKHSASKIRVTDQQQTFLQQLRSCNLVLQLLDEHQSINSDPLTKLDARALLLQKVNHIADEHSVALCLVHCREFQQINKKQGAHVGDQVIFELADAIQACTRNDDGISRLGGALFAVASATNGVKEAEVLGNKLQQYLQQQAYLIENSSNGMPVKLSFHVGVAVVEYDEPNNSDIDKATVLMNRAEQALQASQAQEEPAVTTWDVSKFSMNEEQFNYLGGIFTGDTMTNYRNMLLLWDISSIIADEFEFTKLLHNVVQRLANTFDFNSAGLWRAQSDVTTLPSLCFEVSDNAQVLQVEPDLAFQNKIIEQQVSLAIDSKGQQELITEDTAYWVLPLEVNTDDCFYIVGEASRFILTHDTKVLIQGFVRQIGKALRRSQLEEELNRRLENQNAMLENELNELKGGLSSSALVYKSPVMQTVMKQTQRAAATDTTVLITGESGTGKERLINAIHTLGPRSKKPLIIVDCGSIPETLIESELFGYVKGAFTGAQKGANGKVKEADGGILVLDEIGELPLQMQPKLLRFVQEKHYTPVGGTKVIDVDVKIVAVTNRDLSLEVERGTFRKDLYYRLNVVTLNNPALRERGDDLSLLAQHFLNKFSKQFETEKKYLAPETLQSMQRYPWPGNIRELENKLMQATLLSENAEITLDELNLELEASEYDSAYGAQSDITDLTDSQAMSYRELSEVHENEQSIDVPAQQTSQAIDQGTEQLGNMSDTEKRDNTSRVPRQLQDDTRQQDSQVVDLKPSLGVLNQQKEIETLLTSLFNASLHFLNEIRNQAAFIHLSIGNCVEDELLVLTYQACNGNMRDVSTRLQLPTSTARRRVNKILLNLQSQSVEKPVSWNEVKTCLQPIADAKVCIPDCFDRIKQVLLEAILKSEPDNMSMAAALLGVSEPTFYKLKKQISQLA